MFKNLPTFKSLPQAIGLPFLSTQEDAQLKFKSSDGGIKRLYSDQVSLGLCLSRFDDQAKLTFRSSLSRMWNIGASTTRSLEAQRMCTRSSRFKMVRLNRLARLCGGRTEFH
jgi:hypothetical protein